MIILGIDPGEQRIGIAVSDPLGVTARPAHTVVHTSLAEDVQRVAGLASALGAERIVVGHPLNMDGSVGRSARRARRFANAIRRQSGLDVVLWDERLTTVEAEEALSRPATGSRPPREKEIIDRTAAAIMLQDYLNAHGSAGAPCA